MLVLVCAAAVAALSAYVAVRVVGDLRRNRRHEPYLAACAALDGSLPDAGATAILTQRFDRLDAVSGGIVPDRLTAGAATSEVSESSDGLDGDDARPVGGLPPAARAFFDWVVVVGVALLVAVGVRTFLLAHFVVDGQSMETTLDPGDRVFVNKLSYRLHEPGRGDVVVLHEISGAAERDLIKRVIALPGEQIEMSNCVVRIDGRVLDEPYLDPAVVSPSRCGGDVSAQLVPDDHVFVMGDNRPGSHDSRALGAIPYDDLVGRAFVVFWPQPNWHWL